MCFNASNKTEKEDNKQFKNSQFANRELKNILYLCIRLKKLKDEKT